MSLHWTFPSDFQIDLYRAGWKSDRSFDRIVADLGAGQFSPVSNEETKFTIKANTINKVRRSDIGFLIIPNTEGNAVGPDTRLSGIRLSRGAELVVGISLFDNWRNAPIESNCWYSLPHDVQIPEQLVLVKAARPTKAGAYHFTLGPAESMTLRHFIILLGPLAHHPRVTLVQR